MDSFMSMPTVYLYLYVYKSQHFVSTTHFVTMLTVVLTQFACCYSIMTRVEFY